MVKEIKTKKNEAHKNTTANIKYNCRSAIKPMFITLLPGAVTFIDNTLKINQNAKIMVAIDRILKFLFMF